MARAVSVVGRGRARTPLLPGVGEPRERRRWSGSAPPPPPPPPPPSPQRTPSIRGPAPPPLSLSALPPPPAPPRHAASSTPTPLHHERRLLIQRRGRVGRADDRDDDRRVLQDPAPLHAARLRRPALCAAHAGRARGRQTLAAAAPSRQAGLPYLFGERRVGVGHGLALRVQRCVCEWGGAARGRRRPPPPPPSPTRRQLAPPSPTHADTHSPRRRLAPFPSSLSLHSCTQAPRPTSTPTACGGGRWWPASGRAMVS